MNKTILETIRRRVNENHYLLKSHVIIHALKEGFERAHVVEAILRGTIIEDYADEQRALLCGRATLSSNVEIYLHVVCEYADPVFVEFVTAYVPDERDWENPPLRRRIKKKK